MVLRAARKASQQRKAFVRIYHVEIFCFHVNISAIRMYILLISGKCALDTVLLIRTIRTSCEKHSVLILLMFVIRKNVNCQ